ncbi:hypothetical protein RI543_000918 [Arxiozyma heterogenica]|uniref:XPA C-terminal domain-containing protein n=1 Tax=Arxiozyma heterogenica TaxID=278026 RepID=A0AAN7WSR3_9SACH|nr:hypothetical protein RI543_000918 [Kazachstania heterogenica]
MNEAQRAKIEANRKRALERLKQRGLLNNLQVKTIESRNLPIQPQSNPSSNSSPNSNRITKKQVNHDSLTTISLSSNNNNNNNNNKSNNGERTTDNTSHANKNDVHITNKPKIRPTVRTKDYIDFDFSTMQNLNGGYINPNDKGIYSYHINSNTDDYSYYEGERTAHSHIKTLEDWKEEQRQRRNLYENKPPPEHISQAIKCRECRINIEMDPILDDVFKLNVCKQCSKLHPEKYSLLTKTECKEDYFLTEDELNDKSLFHRLEKPNPHSGTFARMQLFVRCEIEAFAFKKWGGEEGLDKEWERRETLKIKRKEQLYQKEIQTMRLKTRAQEFTKKLRDKKYGNLIHEHKFGEAVETYKDEEDNTIMKRRCINCGLEVDEVEI